MTSPAMASTDTQLEDSRFSVLTLLRSPEKRTLLFVLLLIAAVVFVYRPVAHNGFINFDDPDYLTSNPHVRAGLSKATFKWAFTTIDAAHYHPLTWLSHALDCQLFGMDPSAHHEVNVLFHAANAVLLFLFLQAATGFPWRGLFVAALFALHPINVETVAWASERKNVLSMLFLLLAMLAYLGYARRPSFGRYALVAFLFTLGLLSKSQIITFPFLLLLLDYWPLQRFSLPPWAGRGAAIGLEGARIQAAPRRSGEGQGLQPLTGTDPGDSTVFPSAAIASPPVSFVWLVLEKLPFLALSAACAVITMKAQKAGGAIPSSSVSGPLLRIETVLVSYAHYVLTALWPANLVPLRPQPRHLYPAWEVLASALFLLLLSGAILLAWRRHYLTVGWFWFIGALVPMSGIVRVGAQAMPDHYAYLPLIGLFLLFTWLVADWAQSRRLPAAWIATPALLVLLAFSVVSYHQIGYWRDAPTFWTRTLALTEDNCLAQDALGEYLAGAGRADEGASHFRAALAACPEDLRATLDLSTYEADHGDLSAAVEHYKPVLVIADPLLRATAYGNLGWAYRKLGDLAKARQCFETSLNLDPTRPLPMIGLGLIAQKNGDYDQAIRLYSRAMAIQPTNVGYLLIASALNEEGHTAQAREFTGRAARLSPDLAAAQKEIDTLLGK